MPRLVWAAPVDHGYDDHDFYSIVQIQGNVQNLFGGSILIILIRHQDEII